MCKRTSSVDSETECPHEGHCYEVDAVQTKPGTESKGRSSINIMTIGASSSDAVIRVPRVCGKGRHLE